MVKHFGSDGFDTGIPGICDERFKEQKAFRAILLQAPRAAGGISRWVLGNFGMSRWQSQRARNLYSA